MQHLRKPIGPVINETKSRDDKITKTGRSQNFTNSFKSQSLKHYVYKMLSARAVRHFLVLSENQWGFPYKRTT